MSFQDLMAGPPPTHLPEDPAAALVDRGTPLRDVVVSHPESPLAWAALAEAALADAGVAAASAGAGAGDVAAVGGGGRAQPADLVPAYAFARVGYHRSLDLLRRNGWKGNGPVPWSHEPNRGFLRALASLARAAELIGETAEAERCADFLRDSSPEAADLLLPSPS